MTNYLVLLRCLEGDEEEMDITIRIKAKSAEQATRIWQEHMRELLQSWESIELEFERCVVQH